MWSNAIWSALIGMVIVPALVLLYAYATTNSRSTQAPRQRSAAGAETDASRTAVAATPKHERELQPHSACRIFSLVERLQQEASLPWGHVLDAGTGEHSLSWLVSLPSDSLTAVTGEPERQVELSYLARNVLRSGDRVVSGNWLDASLLAEQQYDTVIADYLLGSVEGFAPGFQTEIFARLRPLVRRRIYVIGLSPLPLSSDEPGGRLLIEIGRARDMCILAAGRRPFREYEKEWARAQLERSGFEIEHITAVTSTYTRPFLRNQIAVASFMLEKAELRLGAEGYLSQLVLPSRFSRMYGGANQLTVGLRAWLDQLRRHVDELPPGEFKFGTDWIIAAKPTGHSAVTSVLTQGLSATPHQAQGLDY
jgi:hypothetical protein